MCRILKDETLEDRANGYLPVGAGFERSQGRASPLAVIVEGLRRQVGSVSLLAHLTLLLAQAQSGVGKVSEWQFPHQGKHTGRFFVVCTCIQNLSEGSRSDSVLKSELISDRI